MLHYFLSFFSFLLFTLTFSAEEGNTNPHHSCPAHTHKIYSSDFRWTSFSYAKGQHL